MAIRVQGLTGLEAEGKLVTDYPSGFSSKGILQEGCLAITQAKFSFNMQDQVYGRRECRLCDGFDNRASHPRHAELLQ